MMDEFGDDHCCDKSPSILHVINRKEKEKKQKSIMDQSETGELIDLGLS